MKKVLIISPYFPPVNSADTHRVRTSLGYFQEAGWLPEVVTVDPSFGDASQDPLLTESIPVGTKVHIIKAFDKTITQKIGLGSLALRSMWFYLSYVSQLLKANHVDLIYFSTTQYPVCILGAFWKKKFGVPFVIDMQDPWHSDYYHDKPADQRPPKYWFSYRLNKYLEPIAMNHADGLISVSEGYINTLKGRYKSLKNAPSAVVTFGMFEPDKNIAIANRLTFPQILNPAYINIVYAGRGGTDMHAAIIPLFEAVKEGLETESEKYSRLRFYFIGTSYAPEGQGKKSIFPLAKVYRISDLVIEITNRREYYSTLDTLSQANALFIPGSDDVQYTASKIYPYLMMEKPILALMNAASSALAILRDFGVPSAYAYNEVTKQQISSFLLGLLSGTTVSPISSSLARQAHSARNKTFQQCVVFNKVVNDE